MIQQIIDKHPQDVWELYNVSQDLKKRTFTKFVIDIPKIKKDVERSDRLLHKIGV